MPTKYCSLCTNKCQPKSNKEKETPILNPSNPSTAEVDEEDLMKNQLRVIFLLRKILEIPQSVCSNLLENCGDPCSWIDFCDACSVLLQNCKVICDQMILLQKQLKTVQIHFKKQIIQELPFEEGLFTEEKLRVKETMRSFILHGNINHNLSSITTAAESTVRLDTLNTSIVLGPSQCVKIESCVTFSNPFMPNDGDQCHSEEKDPLALDGSGNPLDTYSVADIKEELTDHQLCEREQEYNSEINSENIATYCSETKDSEEVNASRGLTQQIKQEPIESLESEDSEDSGRKKRMNSGNALRFRTIKHNNDQSPIRDVSHVSKKRRKRKIVGKVFHPSKALVNNGERDAVDIPTIPSKQFDVKGFTVPNQLVRLARSHSGKHGYECETCGKVSSCHSNLIKHKKLHTGEKPYECKTCGKTFAQSSNLNRHKKSHTGEKPFECKTCGKFFSILANLKSHQRLHTGQKPYECDTCGKTFTQSSNLNEHKMRHAGEKPHKCTFCHKRFITTTKLKLHVRCHTGEKPYDCKICGKLFAHSGSLRNHERVHHGKGS